MFVTSFTSIAVFGCEPARRDATYKYYNYLQRAGSQPKPAYKHELVANIYLKSRDLVFPNLCSLVDPFLEK